MPSARSSVSLRHERTALIVTIDLEGRLRAEGLDPDRWSNGPDDRYPAHGHSYDKVIVVERGSITFRLGTGETVELQTGDRLELPAGTVHDAVVGAVGVSCLEAHRPSGSIARVARHAVGTW
jgi:mannose-6-phosphate isomerase-like protein (cupin superfamily)